MDDIIIEEWQPDRSGASRLEDDLNMLARVLHGAVQAGASVSFVLPFGLEDARAFWVKKVLPGVRCGIRRVLNARCGGAIVGTVQLNLDLPPNQSHRAEVMKLLVHPESRRQGIARMLMIEIEEVARAEGRMLLTLDTRHGDAGELLYRSLDYVEAGTIPRYARSPEKPDLEDVIFMYKELVI